MQAQSDQPVRTFSGFHEYAYNEERADDPGVARSAGWSALRPSACLEAILALGR